MADGYGIQHLITFHLFMVFLIGVICIQNFLYDGNGKSTRDQKSTRSQGGAGSQGSGDQVVCAAGDQRQGAQGKRVPGQGDYAWWLGRGSEAGLPARGKGIQGAEWQKGDA